MLRPSGGIQWHANHQDQHSNFELITNQYSTNQSTKERKRETNDLTRFDDLPTFSGQKRNVFIQTTELQGLQSDPKIQIRETTHLVVKFPQTN